MKLIGSNFFDEAGKAILDQNTELFADIVEKFGTDSLFKKFDSYGNTILHIACSVGNIGAVIASLEGGADLNLKNSCSQDTPLHLAIRSGNLVVIMHLLNNGASVVEKNILGNTAVHEAVISGSNKRVLRKIVERYRASALDENANLLNKEGKMPLSIALDLGADAEVIDILMPLENVTQKECVLGSSTTYFNAPGECGIFPQGNQS